MNRVRPIAAFRLSTVVLTLSCACGSAWLAQAAPPDQADHVASMAQLAQAAALETGAEQRCAHQLPAARPLCQAQMAQAAARLRNQALRTR